MKKLPYLTLGLGLLGHASAAVGTIPASGWNHDMIINNPSPYDLTVTGTMDGGFGQVENNTWVEAGTYTNDVGDTVTIPGIVEGMQTSVTGSGTFTFQPVDQNNVIGLDGGASGTLTLDTPAAYNSVALYGASGFGGKTATVTLAFTDSSTAVFNVAAGEGIGSDWFGPSDVAYVAGARASNKSEEGYTRLFIDQNSDISIKESLFTLDASDRAKLLESVTIENTGGDRMAVFALSGEAVPEPGTALLSGLGILGLLRRRRG